MSIDARDFDHAARELGRHGLERQAGPIAHRAVRDMANAVRRNIRAAARSHRRTGRMIRYVSVKLTGRGFDVQAKVHAGGMVAPMIVKGTRPHDIEPMRSRALAMTARGGRLIGFAALAHHTGTPADPFVRRGIDASTGEVQAITETAARDLLAALKSLVKRGG